MGRRLSTSSHLLDWPQQEDHSGLVHLQHTYSMQSYECVAPGRWNKLHFCFDNYYSGAKVTQEQFEIKTSLTWSCIIVICIKYK